MTWLQHHIHENGLAYIQIDTPQCAATIFMQGAQITAFQPKGAAPLLWSSSANDYLPGVSIRGGIPICWPWFGAAAEANWPAHGFARTRNWRLVEAEQRQDHCVLVLALDLNKADRRFWPHHTDIKVRFELSDKLTVSLINTNYGDKTVELTQALHSYFPIHDIHQLSVSGFKGANYIEFDQGPLPQIADVVRFDRETDRVYASLTSAQQLHTPNGTLVVSRENSQSAVLWNPWIAKSKRLSRFNDDDYLQMVCLEAANVREDKLSLAPGEQHVLTTRIEWL